MNTGELITPPPPPSSAGHPRSADHSARTSESDPPSVGEMLGEIVPLVGFVAVAGPPVIFVVGPWALVVLALIGPFLLLLSFVLAAALVVAVGAAFLAPPYLLVRHIRVHRTHRPAHHALADLLREHRRTGVSLVTRRSVGSPVCGPRASRCSGWLRGSRAVGIIATHGG